MNRVSAEISVKQIFRLFLLSTFSTFLIISTAFAQSPTSVLQGVVNDENKAIVPEAKIVLRDEKGAERETLGFG